MCAAAMSGLFPQSIIEEWLCDIGCGYDLVDKRDVVELLDGVQRADKTVVFETAGGDVPADSVLPMCVKEIDADIEER